jgi:hypothetical protein
MEKQFLYEVGFTNDFIERFHDHANAKEPPSGLAELKEWLFDFLRKQNLASREFCGNIREEIVKKWDHIETFSDYETFEDIVWEDMTQRASQF